MNIKLSVKTHLGSYNNFEINKDSKVKDLKLNVKHHLGLEEEEQTLKYEDTFLDDDEKSLYDYGIETDSEVKLIIHLKKQKFHIYIQLQEKNRFQVEVSSKDKLSKVKKKVQSLCKLSPKEQIWIFQGRQLEGDDLIIKYGIEDKIEVTILQRLINEMKIFVNKLDEGITEFQIKRIESIYEIKKKIHEKLGPNPDEQKLVFRGAILDDNKTAEQCHMEEACTINLVTKLRNERQISVKRLDGKTVTFFVKNNEKIIAIKQKIEQRMEIYSDEQKLIFQGTLLENDKTVEECLIKDCSELKVIVKRSNRIVIFVKTMEGKVVECQVRRNEKILEIKKQLQRKLAHNSDKQKLVFRGAVLEDDKTVEESNIMELNTLNVIFMK